MGTDCTDARPMLVAVQRDLTILRRAHLSQEHKSLSWVTYCVTINKKYRNYKQRTIKFKSDTPVTDELLIIAIRTKPATFKHGNIRSNYQQNSFVTVSKHSKNYRFSLSREQRNFEVPEPSLVCRSYNLFYLTKNTRGTFSNLFLFFNVTGRKIPPR